jgi:hypothetical protein
MLSLGVVVLIASHAIFFNHLRHAGLSFAVVSGRLFWRLPSI